MLKIGEVAAQSGVSIDTLRYYERLGLLPKPARTRSGYRLYDARMVDRLAFIKRAQSFGLTLDEIKQMLQLETANPQTCSRVLEVIEHKLEDINHQYEEIKRLREEHLPEATRRVKVGLVLEAIVEKEGLTVEEEDVSAEIERLASELKLSADEVRRMVEAGGEESKEELKGRILADKALDFVYRHAVIQK